MVISGHQWSSVVIRDTISEARHLLPEELAQPRLGARFRLRRLRLRQGELLLQLTNLLEECLLMRDAIRGAIRGHQRSLTNLRLAVLELELEIA